ncbi:MAG: hypothetical protein ABIJ00_10025 [Candidatus Eisenbacteria bacterium]
MKTLSNLAILIIVPGILLMAGSLFAIPGMINYQGVLVDDGMPVDGTRSVRFRIYDSAGGGLYLWEETQSVSFFEGVFNVLLGSTDAIPPTVFDGSRRWLSVSIDGGPEVVPRGEIVSTGYAFFSNASASAAYADSAGESGTSGYADLAGSADELDGYDSSEFAGSVHSHDSKYYTQTQLNTSDGSPPNQGSNLIHWNILTGMPAGFSDGIDNTGETGPTDHGDLTGLLDNDHPQYAMKDTLKTSDGNPPNTGSNLVHWNVLGGVPSDFADGNDNITTDASAITSGVMAPQRIEGTAIIDSDPRLLSVTQKNELTSGFVTMLHDHDASSITSGVMAPQRVSGTAVVNSDPRLLTVADKTALTGGDTTSVHTHVETGDIESVATGEGLSGGGIYGDVVLSHATDATTMPFAHHYPPVVAHVFKTSYDSTETALDSIAALSIDVPGDGFLYISFSGTQRLHVAEEGPPPVEVPKRYFAEYGVSVDTPGALEYSVTSSMLDTTYWFADHVPSNSIAGSTVVPVSAGSHTVYFLTRITLAVDVGARNVLEKASLTAVYFPYDSESFGSALLRSTGETREGR